MHALLNCKCGFPTAAATARRLAVASRSRRQARPPELTPPTAVAVRLPLRVAGADAARVPRPGRVLAQPHHHVLVPDVGAVVPAPPAAALRQGAAQPALPPPAL